MEIKKITSIDDIDDINKKYPNKKHPNFLFRGHNCFDDKFFSQPSNFPILPNLYRDGISAKSANVIKRNIKSYSSLIMERPSKKYMSLYRLIDNQHLLNNTSLLDVTLNPQIALFFACYQHRRWANCPVDNSHPDESDACLVIFMPKEKQLVTPPSTFVNGDITETKLMLKFLNADASQCYYINPSDPNYKCESAKLSPECIMQHGAFLSGSLDSFKNLKRIFIKIDGTAKKQILMDLKNQCGIDETIVYQDDKNFLIARDILLEKREYINNLVLLPPFEVLNINRHKYGISDTQKSADKAITPKPVLNYPFNVISRFNEIDISNYSCLDLSYKVRMLHNFSAFNDYINNNQQLENCYQRFKVSFMEDMHKKYIGCFDEFSPILEILCLYLYRENKIKEADELITLWAKIIFDNKLGITQFTLLSFILNQSIGNKNNHAKLLIQQHMKRNQLFKELLKLHEILDNVECLIY